MTETYTPTPCSPVSPRLGYVASITLAAPGIVDEITKQGFDARMRGVKLCDNPYIVDGPYGWWKNGWLAADKEMQ